MKHPLGGTPDVFKGAAPINKESLIKELQECVPAMVDWIDKSKGIKYVQPIFLYDRYPNFTLTITINHNSIDKDT